MSISGSHADAQAPHAMVLYADSAGVLGQGRENHRTAAQRLFDTNLGRLRAPRIDRVHRASAAGIKTVHRVLNLQ